MGKDTKIEWTHIPGYVPRTWNPTRGCSHASPGCAHCYAEKESARWSDPGQPFHLFAERDPKPHFTGRVDLIHSMLEHPLHWTKPAAVFVNSMSDLWHGALSFYDKARVYAVMALCQAQNRGHIFMVLTKRPEERREVFTRFGVEFWDAVEKCMEEICGRHGWCMPTMPDLPLRNVWEGVSIESQAYAYRAVELALTPVALRFTSYEPALSELDLTRIEYNSGGSGGDVFVNALTGQVTSLAGGQTIPSMDWVIIGGESGSDARPFDTAWARKMIMDCAATKKACFMKQFGAVPLIPETVRLEVENMVSWAKRAMALDREWPLGTHFGNQTGITKLNGRQVLLKDKKGGNPEEWPEGLRVRQFPEVRA